MIDRFLKKIVIASLSSSDEGEVGEMGAAVVGNGMTVLLGSGFENTQDDEIHHPGRRVKRIITSDDDSLESSCTSCIANSSP